MIAIIGHKNPDTDAVVSACVMGDFLKKRGQKAQAFRAGKVNKETEFVFKEAGIKIPPLIKNISKKEVFLVDHNESEQSVSGIEKADVTGVLDHHKLGGLKNDKPVYFRIEPIGSTSTLIFKLFQENNFILNKKQAFLLLCGILSDTLKFKSPTATPEDIKIAKQLAKICKSNIEELAKEMFKAKSDISGMSLKDLIFMDYKEFQKNKTKFGIGVHETVNPKNVLDKRDEIIKTISSSKKKLNTPLIFFAVVDILKKESYLFVAGEKEKLISKKAFKKTNKNNLVFLSKIVSRKKQIAPAILNVL